MSESVYTLSLFQCFMYTSLFWNLLIILLFQFLHITAASRLPILLNRHISTWLLASCLNTLALQDIGIFCCHALVVFITLVAISLRLLRHIKIIRTYAFLITLDNFGRSSFSKSQNWCSSLESIITTTSRLSILLNRHISTWFLAGGFDTLTF